MEYLTAKEEEVMHILWHLKKAMVKDIIKQLPEPDQPYTTVSSIVRILEKKGFVSHKPYGKTHEYYPLISKALYRKEKFKHFFSDYFDNSIESVVSFLVKEKNYSPKEIEDLTRMIQNESQKFKEDE
jgi:predicted transcriptional regulator